jgi:hypothetical protein
MPQLVAVALLPKPTAQTASSPAQDANKTSASSVEPLAHPQNCPQVSGQEDVIENVIGTLAEDEAIGDGRTEMGLNLPQDSSAPWIRPR